MRKILLTAALVLAVLPSLAQDRDYKKSPYKYEVNIGWGYTPAYTISELEGYRSDGNGGLDHIYGNYVGRTVTTGLMSADLNIQYRKWFALGIQINAVAITNTEMSAITQTAVRKFTDYAVSVLPYARFTYINRECLKMYTSVGAGIGFNHDADLQSSYNGAFNYVRAGFQFVPIGIMVGKRIYGMAEAGLGTEFIGYKIGIGYRF